MNRIIRLRLSILGVVALVASLIFIQPGHSQFQGRPGGLPGMPGRPPGIPGGISGGIAGRPGFSGISGIGGPPPGFSGVSGAGGIVGRPGISGIGGAGGFPEGIGGPPPGFGGINGAGGIAGRPGISGAGGIAGRPGISGAGGIAGRTGFSGISGINGAGGIGGGAGGPAGGIAGDFPKLPPLQMPDFGPPPRVEMPRMADPIDFPKPHNGALSTNVTEWSCSKCNKVLGTGDYAPSYTRCPSCGVRLKPGGSGSGGSEVSSGVLLFLVVLAVIGLIFSGMIYLGVKLISSQMRATPRTKTRFRERQPKKTFRERHTWLDDEDENDRPRRRNSRGDFDDRFS